MDTQIDYPRYIPNKPIGDDQFEGKAHKRLAISIAEHIKSGYPGIIGLEGEWGAGKSNVIEILRQELRDTHYIYIYDAWGHQEDSQRRAFLEELTEELVKEKLLTPKTKYTDLSGKVHKINWEEKIKFLLARKRETIKKEVPRLSPGIIIVGIVVIFTPLLTLISEYLGSSKEILIWKILFSGALVFLFLSVLLGYCCVRWICQKLFNKCNNWNSIASWFYIFKGDKLESTTNEVVSDLEPSVREFKNWMQDISESLEDKELVIVFDNMDRLPPEKVKEIWSSIHTFFAEEKYNKISVTITFDKEHLQKAFDDDAQKASEFINKTFSIIYRVTPPVLTDWKDFFRNKYREAFGRQEEDELNLVLLIFDRLKERFTPRDIIVFINNLVMYKKIWKDEIKLRYIAIWVLKKDEILKNPVKNIIEESYLDKVKDLFAGDAELSNYISALVFNVPVDKASQVLLLRDIELALRGENNINDFVLHPHFIDILEEIVGKEYENLDIDKAIQALSKLEMDKIKSGEAQERITKIWDKFVSLQTSKEIDKLEFKEKYKILLLNASIGSKTKLIEFLVSQFQKFESLNGGDYYRAFSSLEQSLEDDESLKNEFYTRIREKTVEPQAFLQYLKEAKAYYRKFKLRTDSQNLDNYIADKIPNNLSNLPALKELSFIKEEYSFEATLEKIEVLINANQLSKNNFYHILTLYKAILNEKPLRAKVSTPKLANLLQQVRQEEEGFTELLAIRLAYGNRFNHSLPAIDLILKRTDENLVKNIAQSIEYYANYGDLLLMGVQWHPNLFVAVCKDLMENEYDEQKLSIVDVLKKFEDIKNAFKVEPEILLRSLERRADNTKEQIDVNNLREVIPNYKFFEYSTSIELELTKHVNNVAKKYLDIIDQETLVKEWNNNSSYNWNLLYILMGSGLKKALPANFLGATKEILKRIASSNLPVPQRDTIWSYFIEKAKVKKVIPTIKDIRDDFIQHRNIDCNLFVFFEEFLRVYGALTKRAGDVVRTILARVVSENRCLDLILENDEFYIKLINQANEDAEDFKERLLQRAQQSPDERITSFAKKVGFDIDTEE